MGQKQFWTDYGSEYIFLIQPIPYSDSSIIHCDLIFFFEQFFHSWLVGSSFGLAILQGIIIGDSHQAGISWHVAYSVNRNVLFYSSTLTKFSLLILVIPIRTHSPCFSVFVTYSRSISNWLLYTWLGVPILVFELLVRCWNVVYTISTPLCLIFLFLSFCALVSQ